MKKITTTVVTALMMMQASGQQYFSSIALVHAHNSHELIFGVPCESNVFSYRVEAGNDEHEFDIIGTIKPVGNTMLPKQYNYKIYDMQYKYYRIERIGMNGSQQCSTIVTNTGLPAPIEQQSRPFRVDSNAIVNGRK
jgi:hypothetical protein